MKTSTAPRSARRMAEDDRGWVMVPVIALLVVALGLGFALLAVVDTQTASSREKRASDAAQTFAEGLVAATASVMATHRDADTWKFTGPCRSISGRLSSTSTANTLEGEVINAVHARFAGTSSDVADDGLPLDVRRTTWSVQVCPVAGEAVANGWTQNDEDWNANILDRTMVAAGAPLHDMEWHQPAGNPPRQLSMWVRGQGNVQSLATAANEAPRRSRAVVSKIRQVGTDFKPDPYAVSTGGLQNALSTSLSHALFNTNTLVGGLTSKLIGTKPLVTGPIGTRCSLLDDLDLTNLSGLDLSSLCLNATLGGVSGATEMLGLGAVNSLLGVSDQKTLKTWAVAPPDALAAYAEVAKRDGTYFDSVAGYGNDTVAGKATAGTNACVNWSAPAITSPSRPANTRVIYIKQVGNGEQYCSLTSGTAAIVIVERGAIRVTGGFTGIVYAANLQECGTDGVCTKEERETGGKAANRREVIRVEGPGTVTGALWADGAGGQVGIYPPTAVTSGTRNPTVQDLLNSVKDPNSQCGQAPVGLADVATTLGNSLGGLLGGLLTGLLGGDTVTYTLPDGQVFNNVKPNGCQLLVAALKTQGVEQLSKLLTEGGQITVVVTTSTRSCGLLGLGCTTTNGSYQQTVTLPASGAAVDGSTSAIPPNPVTGILGMVNATLSGYQAVVYDQSAVDRASVSITTGGSPVVGSYQRVPNIGGFGS